MDAATTRYGSDAIPRLTPDQCRQRLADALGDLVSRQIQDTATVTVSGLGDPGWVPYRDSHMWVAPVDFTFEVGGIQDTARIDWPVPWDPQDGTPCQTAADEEPVLPGCHQGLYIGSPLVVGQGVRLRPGLHVIPRPTSNGPWLDLVVSPLLGIDKRPAPRKWDELAFATMGKFPGMYVDDELRQEMLSVLNLNTAENPHWLLVVVMLGLLTVLPEKRDWQTLGAVVLLGRRPTDNQLKKLREALANPDEKKPNRTNPKWLRILKENWDLMKEAVEASPPSNARDFIDALLGYLPEVFTKQEDDPVNVDAESIIAELFRTHGIESPEMTNGVDQPRRTAASINRLFGADEVMAELVFERIITWTKQVFTEKATPEEQTEEQKREKRLKKVKAWLEGLPKQLVRSAGAAIWALASGGAYTVSVVHRTDEQMTLTRVEQSARTCFLGFRGIGKIRGRADLRDLEPGWRGVLCPVQTPESKDTGLVRYAAVGQREDAPENLSEWFDLSASAALIPFIDHDDPARASIGSKNLKQAVPVVQREPPLVATGWERVFGSAEGVARAPEAGRVGQIEPGAITVETRRGKMSVATGAPWQRRSQVNNEWFMDVKVGDRVSADQVLAHAPDVELATGEPELCLGLNALVALTPWHGANFEDAIVVSQSFAQRMASSHIIRVDEPWMPGDELTLLMGPLTERDHPIPVQAGETLALIKRNDDRTDEFVCPVNGELLVGPTPDRSRTPSSVFVMVRVSRPLAVGDKLSNRHQGKGVVSAILPDDQMPRLPEHILGGRPVEAILNPLGVLRRLNIGQLWEMHVGLAAMLTDGKQVRVGRTVKDPDGIGEALSQLGAPRGRLPLILPDGSRLGGDDIVVGPQYIMKLNHLASAKLSVRAGQPSRSPVSSQPSQGRRYRHDHWIGSAQRLGEMEVWALEAEGALDVLSDAFHVRSAPRDWEQGKPRASLRAVQAHLAIGGLELDVNADGPRPLQEMSVSELRALTTVWRREDYPQMPHWRELSRWDKPASDVDLARLVARFSGEADLDQSPYDGEDPLYREDVHGRLGTPEAEMVRYCIPLPFPVGHPWGTETGPCLPEMNSVPVLPPAFRVATPKRRGLDKAYQQLATFVVQYERAVGDLPTSELSAEAKRQRIQLIIGIREAVGKILGTEDDSVGKRLVGKRGLLSRYLLGQSVCYSGRSVIVPDMGLAPDQIGLPQQLSKGLGIDRLNPAPDDDVVILNRQPSLHPYNLVALRAVEVDGDAIRLHPLYLGGLAGDFDGDTVAVHRPQTHAGRRDAWERLSPASRIRSSANGTVLAKMDLDIALGLYLAGRVGALPDVLGAVEQEFDAAAQARAIDQMVTAYDQDAVRALKVLDEVERAGLKAAVGWSIGALDLLEARQELLVDGDGLESVAGWLETVMRTPEMRSKLGLLADAVAAGVAGGERAVTQLVVAQRAEVGDHAGHPDTAVPVVKDCYLMGLTPDDYFGTAPVALAELAHKKLTTPKAGQLTKELVAIADLAIIGDQGCSTPSAIRSPLTCSSANGICQACYGPDPGRGQPPRIGSRIGVLAATLIGERSTQEAMKAFQGGGGRGEALGNALDDLYAIFGKGRSTVLGVDNKGQPLGLSDWLLARGDLTDLSVRAEALQPLVDLAVTRLGGKVAAVHVQVVLRQLLDAFLLQYPPIPETSQQIYKLEVVGGSQIRRPEPSEIEGIDQSFADLVATLFNQWLPIILPDGCGHVLTAVELKTMKSQWGSLRRKTDSVSVNLRLASRDPRLLEYLIVHKLTQYYSEEGAPHGQDWQTKMNEFLPGWRLRDLELRPGPLVDFAQQRGRSLFETATTRGNLNALTDTGEVGIGGLRTKLVAGGLS